MYNSGEGSGEVAAPPPQQLGNANPEGIFQTRVYGFDGLRTRVPGYPGLMYRPMI